MREADAGLTLELRGLSQALNVASIGLRLWGTPWDVAHDTQRGNCLNEADPEASHGACPAFGTAPAPASLWKSYLTLPPAPCAQPLGFTARMRSWQGESAETSLAEHGGDPLLLTDCNSAATVSEVELTGVAAAVGTGFSFGLQVQDGGGLLNPAGETRPAIAEAVLTLPEGLTINPSVAVGLGVCSAEDFARETLASAPGEGCPNASKIGEVRVEGMLGLPRSVQGSLFLATPHRNLFGTLLALYLVAGSRERGLLVKSVGKVEPDPRSGRLVITFRDLPRLQYTRFEATLREGQRAMLISPPSCGSYATEVEMTSWDSADPPQSQASAFAISSGPGGGSCPPPGAPPFAPGLRAGSLNPNAASYTPVYLRMTRVDGEQAIVSYSAKLPPGLLAKIAGTEICPEAAIAAAKANSAAEELANPSCPPGSRIGGSLVGGGVGRALAWAPGSLYLAGPDDGAALTVVAITAARIGPFDLGTVVVRAVPRFDSRTTQVSVDATRSDPIPHILAGIPVHVRDIRVYVDRPGFTLNPTNCDPLAFSSTLGGAGADPFSRTDDILATSTERFQMLNCAALGFRPRLSLRAKGATRRAAYPSLRAVYRSRPGRRQSEARLGDPAKGLFPRTGAHRGRLLEHPVRVPPLSSLLDLRLRQGVHPVAGRATRRAGLSAQLYSPPA